ncbi:gluconate 2-dehydrogenase subunit 3 family protein [Virgibacillus sp. W0181]|uniref:gluconate 2-dehydrogenase subunit 3 family protein n=1 Tax=Virgibacillus sp. W0181 TaxID=3391581 RepID=UPI003F48B823
MSGKGDKEGKTTTNDPSATYDHSRRKFIKNSGLVVGGLAGGSLLGGLFTNQFMTETAPKDVKDSKAYTEARMFFTRYEDFVVLEQATERIFPKNDSGPGAIELGVPYFIDKQMAGTWGINGNEYRYGPFMGAEATVDQSSLTRGQIMISGIRKMNQLSHKRFDASFDKVEESQQIEILEDFSKGKVQMDGVNSGSFFSLLRTLTIEGVYSDPLYGGNRNMAGWKMKEYPGAVASYTDIIESDEFVKKDPVSLTDYQQKT